MVCDMACVVTAAGPCQNAGGQMAGIPWMSRQLAGCPRPVPGTCPSTTQPSTPPLTSPARASRGTGPTHGMISSPAACSLQTQEVSDDTVHGTVLEFLCWQESPEGRS